MVLSPTPPHRSGFLSIHLEVYSLVPCFSARREPSSVPPTLFQEPHCRARRGVARQPWHKRVSPARSPPQLTSWAQAHSSSLGVRDFGLPWTQSPQSPPAPSVSKARPPAPSVWLLPDAQVTSQHLSTMTLLVSESWLLKNLSLTTNTQEQPRSSPPRTLPGHCLTSLSRRKARESRNLGCLIPCSDSWAWHTGGSQDLLNEQINE